jgi:hypothetical protein
MTRTRFPRRTPCTRGAAGLRRGGGHRQRPCEPAAWGPGKCAGPGAPQNHAGPPSTYIA